jgi:hypothetical protein
MSFGKGSNQTTTQTTGPDPTAMAAYRDLLSRAQGVASTPFQNYGGEFVAPVNAQQQMGIGNINANAGFAQPYIQQAAGYANQAAQPLTATQIAQYQSPYTQQVVDATQRQFDRANSQAQNNLRGRAAAQGALGGNAAPIAAADMAYQQQLGQAPVIAGLMNQGYQTALGTAQQQQQNLGNAAYSLGNLGVAGQNAALTGAGAQLGAGSLQQQTQQAQNQALYQQFLAQQAYPFQTTQWLGGLTTGVGSQMGGTSSTTAPPPNDAAKWAGLGLSAAGMFLRDGGRVRGYDGGGVVGAMPYGAGVGYVPMLALAPGKGAPEPPKLPSQGSSGSGIPGVGSMPKIGGGSGLSSLFGGASLGTAGTEGFSGLVGGEAAPLGGVGSYAGAEAPSALAGFGDTLASWGTGAWEGLAGVGAGLGEWFGGLGAGMGDWFGGIGEGLGSLFGSGMGEGIAEAAPALFALVKDGGRVGTRRGYDDGGFVQAGFGTGSIVPAWRDNDILFRPDIYGGRPILVGGAPPMPRDNFAERFAGVAPVPTLDRPLTFAERAVPVQEAIASGAMLPEGGTQPNFDPAPVTGVEIALPRARPPEAQEAYEAGLVTPGMELPPEATSTVGELPPGGAFAPPEAIAGVGATPATAAEAKQRAFGLGLLSPAAKQALMAAGLGMLASRSPHFGVALGEGGLQGLNTYAGVQKQEREEKRLEQQMKHQNVQTDIAVKRLAQDADKAAKDLALRTQGQAETKRYHDILDQQRKDQIDERRTRSGYVKNPDGSVSPIKGGPHDPEQIAAVAKAKATGGVLPDDTADFLAERILAGDSKALTNLGRGAQGAENIIKVQTLASRKAAERGMNPSDILAKVAEQSGLTAQQRTFGTQVARMAVNSTEAEGAIQQGLEVSQKVPRGKFVPINRLIQMAESNISDPDLLEFRAANLAIINTYARAISPTGVPTVHDKEEAMKVVSEATSPEAYQRVMKRMLKEIEIAHQAPLKAKEEMERIRKSGKTGTEPAAPAGGAPAATAPAAAPAAGGEKAKRVIQGGWEYELQPDGGYKPLRKVP